MSVNKLKPHEKDAVDAQGEDHRVKQPYASELDDRELEHAHKEDRPVDPTGESARTGGESGR